MTFYYHRNCAREECKPQSELDNGPYTVLEPDENYRTGDCDDQLAVCEWCGEPSELGAKEQTELTAYWEAHYYYGSEADWRLEEMSDDELDQLSRDCGRKLSRT
jgi:hypothetical protein